jgi:hypothetical protein
MATAGGDDHTRPGRGADFLSDASRLSALKLARSVWTSEVRCISMEYLDQHRHLGQCSGMTPERAGVAPVQRLLLV